jgi:hypothetical protein
MCWTLKNTFIDDDPREDVAIDYISVIRANAIHVSGSGDNYFWKSTNTWLK